MLNDFEDATQAKVTARLSSLVKEGYAVKENVKVENLEEQPKKQQRRSKAQVG